MIAAELATCAKKTNDSKIKLSEKKSKSHVVFLNLERETYFVIRVDGCVVRNEVASDFALSKLGIGEIIVELKGMDVDHAVEQIMATSKMWKEKKYISGKIAGLVICTRKPSFDTKVARFASKFMKEFKAPLHVVSGSKELKFENILSFQGPY